MNELRKCRALLLVSVNSIAKNVIVYLEESKDRLDVIFKKGEFFASLHNYTMSITKNWCVGIAWSSMQNYESEYGKTSALAMRTFMHKHFPNYVTQGEIVSCALLSPDPVHIHDGIHCNFNLGSRVGWQTSIRFGNSTTQLPVDMCLDIITRAMYKFNLRIIDD